MQLGLLSSKAASVIRASSWSESTWEAVRTCRHEDRWIGARGEEGREGWTVNKGPAKSRYPASACNGSEDQSTGDVAAYTLCCPAK